MSTWIKVARCHLVDKTTFVVVPWLTLAVAFLLDLAKLAMNPTHASSLPGFSGVIYVLFAISGVQSIVRSLPFALTLGASRRAYFTGTALFAVALAAVYGLVLALLQFSERATGGWGVAMHFFRVPWLLAGPWYLSWLTSFVLLALLFVYGMWTGIVYWRWNVIGTVVFGGVQAAVLLLWALLPTWTHAFPSIGQFFTARSPMGLTGVLGALAVLLLAGGYATVRRVTV